MAIDPTLVTLIVAGVGYVVSKRSASKSKDVLASVQQELKRQVIRLLGTEAPRDAARKALASAAELLLVKLEVKRSAAIDALVGAAIEAALDELEDRIAERLHVREVINHQVSQLVDGTDRVVRAFQPKVVENYPNVEPAEIVEP